MKKKVLYLITKATWGGAQKYVYDLATNLPKEEFEPVVAYGDKGKLSDELVKAGIQIKEIPALKRDVAILPDIKSLYQILRIIREVRPDILHLNSSKAAALGALAARISGVERIIFTVHGWPFKESRNVLWRILTYKISWFTALLSHAIIVVSKTDEEIGRRMWFIRKKTNYIPLALIALKSSEMFTKEQVEDFLFTGSSASFKNAIRLVTIAELTPNKGLNYGIDMMLELERRAPGKYKYAIIGEGEERFSLASYAQKKDIALSVWFASFSANIAPKELSSEASRYLPAFDIFILPSLKEGMPYVLLEAAEAGLPIVATDVVKTEALNLPNIRFVPPKDARALVDAVEKLAQNLPTGKPGKIRSFQEMLVETIALY